MLRRIVLGLVSLIALPQGAFAQPTDFKGAMASGAYISCLLWTRDRVPIREVAKEAGVKPLAAMPGTSEERWQLDFEGGHLEISQHNDGSLACTVMVFGVPQEMVVANVEQHLVGDGMPEFIRFDFVRAKDGDVIDRFYRQRSDKKISAVLSTPSSVRDADQPSAMLTFFYEKP